MKTTGKIFFTYKAKEDILGDALDIYGTWTKDKLYDGFMHKGEDFVSIRNDTGMYTQFSKSAFKNFTDKHFKEIITRYETRPDDELTEITETTEVA